MRAPYLTPVASGDETPLGGDAFSPRDIWLAVRRRWWAVPLVFVVFVSVGIWRTLREPHIYRAATTVRIENATSPIAGGRAVFETVLMLASLPKESGVSVAKTAPMSFRGRQPEESSPSR